MNATVNRIRKAVVQETVAAGDPMFSCSTSLLIAVILELAHAIARGRKPNSCSLLPGVNLREWVYQMYSVHAPGCRDMYGDECSPIEELEDTLFNYQTPSDMKIYHAIRLVGKHLWMRRRQESEERGDYLYQMRNKVTNLKKKRERKARKDGSVYNWDELPNLDFMSA